MKNTNKNQFVGLKDEQIKTCKQINRYIQTAINSWTNNNNSGGMIPDMSSLWYGKAEKLIISEALKNGFSVKIDYPGLYPTYVLTKDEKNYHEYNVESFYRRINGFWHM